MTTLTTDKKALLSHTGFEPAELLSDMTDVFRNTPWESGNTVGVDTTLSEEDRVN